jgi:hypothetical protein
MATINSKVIVDKIIAGNGWFEDVGSEPRVIRIVQYNNKFNGGIAYGLIFEGEDPLRYHMSYDCHNPRTIWDAGS